MNPLDALADFILGRLKQSAVAKWLQLLFSVAFSGVNAFLWGCGTGLVARAPVGVAIGGGMLLAVICMTVVFRRSPLTKGLFVVLPADEAGKELETSVQSIQR